MNYREHHVTATGFRTHQDYTTTSDKLFAPDIVADVLDAPWTSVEAVPPFRLEYGYVFDSTGSPVLVCSDDGGCSHRYAERRVDAQPWFMCPECGRIGQRMEEATPKECGLDEEGKPVVKTIAQRKLSMLIERGAVVTGESEGRTLFRLRSQRGMIDKWGRVMWETMPPKIKTAL